MKRKTAGDGNTSPIAVWDDVICPICMEHPHNAVILRCSSYKKGCRSYICDTSYMHSNCLDRFAQQSGGLKTRNHSMPSSSHWTTSGDFSGADLDLIDGNAPFFSSGNRNLTGNDIVTSRGGVSDNSLNQGTHLPGEQLSEPQYTELSVGRVSAPIPDTCQPDTSITCPLCRGIVTGWEISVEGRRHLNLLKRSCSHDDCSFSGNYRELRQHARNDHLGVSSMNPDPTREQTWHLLEQQRERDDIMSALHSETPDAVVLGDHVIERGGRHPDEHVDGFDRLWLEALYVLHMIDTARPESSRRLRPWSRHRRFLTPERVRIPPRNPSDRRALLWGENLLGIQDDEDNIELQGTTNANLNEPEVDQSPARG